MSKHTAGLDFAQWVPGFDFLQQAAQAYAPAPQAQMPGGSPAWAQWLAPTLDPKEAARRIQELKTVLFWLEQNATALRATIQALEVQQLTCQTLQDMQAHWMSQAGQAAWAPTAAPEVAAASAAEASSAEVSSATTGAGTESGSAPSANAWQGAAAQAGQWWGSLLHTFGQIAQQAQQEVAQRQAAFVQAQGQDLQRPDVGNVSVDDGATAASAATTAKPQAPRRAKASANARARSSRAEVAPRVASVQGSKRFAVTTKQRENKASTKASATVKPTGVKLTRSQAKAALSKAASAGAPSATPTAASRATKSATRKRG
ncbi:MAG: hypothetical protein Q4A11_06830 [Brachymonas sp.]|nr:hypothetical protein [Brachymonas sp.]